MMIHLLMIIFANIFASDVYSEKVQDLFNRRCIACHSCFDSPCQINLQSYEGLNRGGSKGIVYDGTRLKSIKPTRLGIDGETPLDWKRLHFYSVLHNDAQKSILLNSLRETPIELKDLPALKVEESKSCIDNLKDLRATFSNVEDLKMPYGLQGIKKEEIDALKKWLQDGQMAPLKTNTKLDPDLVSWEEFLNKNSEKEKLVSRYLYEHLFLAHIYSPNNSEKFYRLVRSKTSCQDKIDIINTRRPNDYPGMDKFYYCLKSINETVVAKTHMPFLFSKDTLERTKNIFFKKNWEISSKKSIKELYANSIAENPFIAFKDIPPEARYQFLLENAHYMVSTFIKGPVCNGSAALNSIQDQFFVFFLKPESSFLVYKNGKNDDFSVDELLMLPGIWGSDVLIRDTLKLSESLMKKREEYRSLKFNWMKERFPDGIGLNQIWDGEGNNSNAALTVFRHDDNAIVLKGYHGDISKTFFVLDYSLFERLVYNLVVNFDVFGNIGHQLLTRMYMDYIRMEAEENFLLFMPANIRADLRKDWYKGIFTNLTMKYLFPLMATDSPVAIKYSDDKNAKQEFFYKLFYEYLKPDVRGGDDFLNRNKIQIKNEIESKLSKITSTKTIVNKRFPMFYPETSYLIVELEDKKYQVYTIIKNRDHENISWILGESLRLKPENDTLTLISGFAAFYPNYFFKVKLSDLDSFIDENLNLKDSNDFSKLKSKFGVSRVSNDFWNMYDLLNGEYKKLDQLNFGWLDLSRYLME